MRCVAFIDGWVRVVFTEKSNSILCRAGVLNLIFLGVVGRRNLFVLAYFHFPEVDRTLPVI